MKGISKKRWKEIVEKIQKNRGRLPDIDTIILMLSTNWTQSDIARKYGVSRQSVFNVLKRHDVI